MKKVINFGKYAICAKRKINSVDVEIEFEDGNLSICVSVWNGSHTDIVMGGQCLDEISSFVKNGKFKKIYRLWKLYHLNDTNAGTAKQENALVDCPHYDYDKRCEWLKERNLYNVTIEDCDHWEGHKSGEPYFYGQGWIKFDIPESDVKEIESLFV